MNLYAIFAIYFLMWVICAFIMLPFGIRTPDETGEVLLKGQADSAPSNFRPGLVMLRATIMATILFGLYYANYVQGWVSVDMLPGYRPRGMNEQEAALAVRAGAVHTPYWT